MPPPAVYECRIIHINLKRVTPALGNEDAMADDTQTQCNVWLNANPGWLLSNIVDIDGLGHFAIYVPWTGK